MTGQKRRPVICPRCKGECHKDGEEEVWAVVPESSEDVMEFWTCGQADCFLVGVVRKAVVDGG